MESSPSLTPLGGRAPSGGEAVLAGLNKELKKLFRMLTLSRLLQMVEISAMAFSRKLSKQEFEGYTTLHFPS